MYDYYQKSIAFFLLQKKLTNFLYYKTSRFGAGVLGERVTCLVNQTHKNEPGYRIFRIRTQAQAIVLLGLCCLLSPEELLKVDL